MKIVYMGTPDISAFVLEKIIEAGYNVVAAVSQPDKEFGRGKKITPSPVKTKALENNIQVFTPSKIKAEKFHETLKPLDPDLIIVFAYGKILPPEILNLPKIGCINIHLSMLPKYRGAAPVQWAILNGEEKTGATIMKIDEGLDTGDIIKQEEVEILDDDDSISLTNTLLVFGISLLADVLKDIKTTGKIESFPQDSSQATYAHLIKKELGLINWNDSSKKIKNQIRGLLPWPCAHTSLNGTLFKIQKSEIYMNDKELAEDGDEKSIPGAIIKIIKNHGPVVKTGDGCIIILQGQPANKQSMSGNDLINGGYIKEGNILQ